MIAYIKGNLTYIQEDSVVVDVHGIGYEIVCANPFVFQSSLNKEVQINTFHYVREDIQVLYGFKSEDEKQLFIKLISVSGIGPKGALAILGSVDVAGFISAIEREDDKFLTSFPGIGKKTARQIILDLKGKLTTMLAISGHMDADAGVDESNGAEGLVEAEEALKALGYTEREIKTVIPELRKESTTNTDEIIRKALALLMKH
ncbi:Holliday junction branch migration protein RuvA [Virgibacillus sp. NKC19-16]|uniref:Holliday junction branch migration protein RuvA n=1 Tax=Virgibacillus salidurans TaxID=2831673 RepID=UPI001F25628C|nr:Holliday junction branch migration protein RuvA [Virgibacillus sp. NKC19-16]UJL44953.1 Holliday junction branch migration protein RuvA [Virgibacillus sp. NKC19-16]